MATAIGDLVARLRMDTVGFRKGARGATGSLRVMHGAAGALTASLLGGGGLAFAFAKMGQATNAFEGAMNRSVAIMTDVNATIRKDMERTALSVAFNTKFSAREAADAYFFLASAGMDAAQSIAVLESVARFAQAGNFDLSVATDLSTDALSALGLKSADAATNARNLQHVMDNLVKANTLANASVEQFSQALTNKAGAAMRLLGIEIEEGLAVLSVWADQGVKAGDAGTRFDIVLRDLTNKAILNAEAFKKAGIAVFEFGEIRNIADIVEDMERKMGKMTDRGIKAQLMMLGFTQKNVSATASLLGFSGAIREYEAELQNAAGTTDKVADNMTDMDKAWAKAGASMQKMSNEFFPPILDGFASMIEGITGTTEEFNKSAEAMTRWQKAGQRVTELGEVALTAARLVGGVAAISRGEGPEDRAERADWFGRQVHGIAEPVGFGEKARAERETNRAARDAARDVDRFNEALARGRGEIGKDLPPGLTKFLPFIEEESDRIQDELDEAMDKFNDKLKTMGATMRAVTRTPMEQYQRRLKDINNLLRLGAIDADTAARAQAQAADALRGVTGARPTTGPRLAGAMERGSAEAFSTIVQAGKGGEKIAKEHLRIAKQQLAETKNVVRKLDVQTVSIPVG